jgi:hypothetical protein
VIEWLSSKEVPEFINNPNFDVVAYRLVSANSILLHIVHLLMSYPISYTNTIHIEYINNPYTNFATGIEAVGGSKYSWVSFSMLAFVVQRMDSIVVQV